jgi:hypothetical protein
MVGVAMLSNRSFSLISNVAAQPDFQSIANQIPREQAVTNMDGWLTRDYNMILISPPEWHEQSQILANWKNKMGIRTIVVSNWSITEGVDDPERIRNTIKWYYNRYSIEWVLLMGGTSKIPIRYVYIPDIAEVGSGSEPSGADRALKPTDYYYAELTANWSIDGDHLWGERGIYNSYNGTDEFDWQTEVYVGRFPANTATELMAMINKTISYEQGVGAGDWMNRYLAVSGISDYPYSKDLNGEDEAFLNQYIIDNIVGEKMNWAHFYEATEYYNIPPQVNRSFTLQRQSMTEAINWGTSLAIWAGHGAPSYFQSYTVGGSLYASDISSLNNTHMYPLLYSDACSTAMIDYPGGIGEAFIKAADAGGIGFIGSTRISWYWPNDTDISILNRGLARAFMEAMFVKGYTQQGKALYESKMMYQKYPTFPVANNQKTFWETERKVLFCYILLGDPTVSIYTDVAQTFNPLFNDSMDYYEGTRISKIIQTTDGKPVPNAVVTLWNGDQYYKTYKSNAYGQVDILLPIGPSNLSYSINAPNMIYTSGEFVLKADVTKPIFESQVLITPKNPTVGDKPLIAIQIYDTESGVADAYVVLTTDAYKTNRIFEMFPYMNQTGNLNYSVQLPLLEFNSYEYLIVAFDYSGNYEVYYDDIALQSFTVPVPIQMYALIGMNGILIGAVVISFSILTKGVLKKINGNNEQFDDFDSIEPIFRSEKEAFLTKSDQLN